MRPVKQERGLLVETWTEEPTDDESGGDSQV